MATQVQTRRGSTVEHSTFTGAVAEVTVDTDKDTLVVHDGATVGGRPLLREDQSNLPTSAPTTGFYNASGALALSTNGTGRLFVDASGRVGVGAAPGSVAFDVAQPGTSSAIIRAKNDATSVYLDANNGYSYLNTFSNHPFLIGTNNTERLRITSAGLVGIGTSAPTGALQVRHTSTAPSLTTNTGAALTLDGNSTVQVNYGTNPSSPFAAWIQTRGTIGNNAYPISINPLGGNVGIGTASPVSILDLFGTDCKLRVRDIGQTNGLEIYQQNADGGSRIFAANNNYLAFGTNNTERARIDSSGRLLVGTSSSNQTSAGEEPFAQVAGTDSRAGLSLIRYSNNSNGGGLYIGKSRGASVGANAAVIDGDELGRITFSGNDGTDTNSIAARIQAFADGTPGADSMPGRIVLSTTPNGSASPVERMRITSSGRVGVAQAAPATTVDINGAQSANVTAVAALDINCSLGNTFTKTVSANSTFTVSSVPASRSYAFTLEVTHTSGTITWFSGVTWPGGTAPTLTEGKVHLFMFFTDDGGTTWRGSSLINY